MNLGTRRKCATTSDGPRASTPWGRPARRPV